MAAPKAPWNNKWPKDLFLRHSVFQERKRKFNTGKQQNRNPSHYEARPFKTLCGAGVTSVSNNSNIINSSLSASQYQVLFEKWDANDKNNNLTYGIWQSIVIHTWSVEYTQ